VSYKFCFESDGEILFKIENTSPLSCELTIMPFDHQTQLYGEATIYLDKGQLSELIKKLQIVEKMEI